MFTRDNGLLMTPGLILGVGLLVLNHNIKSVFALPAALLVIPAGFYAILYASGNDLDDARLALGTGWVANVSTSNNTQFWHTWNGFQFKHVKLAKVLPSVISTWFAMFFVVAFGSCLDVAAIQMELGRRLDFNKELKTVGISNILSGLTGGFTGMGDSFFLLAASEHGVLLKLQHCRTALVALSFVHILLQRTCALSAALRHLLLHSLTVASNALFARCIVKVTDCIAVAPWWSVGSSAGSYIFSQTIFTMRAGVESSLNGIVIVLCLFIFFAMPISLVSECCYACREPRGGAMLVLTWASTVGQHPAGTPLPHLLRVAALPVLVSC